MNDYDDIDESETFHGFGDFDPDDMMTQINALPRKSSSRGGARGSKVWSIDAIKSLLDAKTTTIDFKSAIKLRLDLKEKVAKITSQPTQNDAQHQINLLLWGCHNEFMKRISQLGVDAKVSPKVDYSKGKFTIEYD